MSGRDRNERRRRKDDGDRDRSERKDRRQSSTSDSNPMQKPMILLKRPDAASVPFSQSQPAKEKDKNPEDTESKNPDADKESNSKVDSTAPPIVLLRPSIAKRKTEKNTSDGVESQKEIKNKSILAIEEARKPLAGKFNNGPITLIDNNMKIRPIGPDYFSDNSKLSTDFFVITIVGKPNTGKSTVLSNLINSSEKFGDSSIFKQRSRQQELDSFMYITPDNVIYIELASLFNCSATYDLTSFQGTLESTSLTWNLRLMRFAFTVSHVVLIVSDNILDPNVCQLISSAEMIRPMESALGEGMYPEIVYVCNKVHQSVLNDKKLQSQYQFIFNSVAGRSPRIKPNIFMLPEIKWGANFSRCEDLKAKIRQFMIYSRATYLGEVDNIPKTPQKYSAHVWYTNAIKSWEDMNNPNYFASYVKLFP